MENKVVDPVEELIGDVDMFNRAREYTDGKGIDDDIESLIKIVRIYKRTIETMYGRRALHRNPEELAQEMIDDAWYAQTQAREVLSAK